MIIPLEDRRQQFLDLISKFQHLCGGVPLFFIGLRKFAEGDPEWPIAALEVGIALAVMVTFLRELRATVRPGAHGHGETSHSSVGWFDLAAGAMLIFEAFHGHHTKPGYLRPPFFAGMTTLALGIFHGRLASLKQRRRYLKVDELGLEYRLSRFRRLRLTWAELESVHVAEQRAAFHRKDGKRHTIKLGRLHNHGAVQEAIAEHARQAGLLSEPRPASAAD